MRIVSLVLAVLLLFTTQSAGAKAPVSEWLLKQTHEEAGKHSVYITPDAVKIVCESQAYVIIARAPSWQVCCYRPKEKIQWLGNLDDFNGIIMRNPFAVPSINKREVVALSTVHYQGLKCTRYCPPHEMRPVILGADDIPISAKGAELLCRYYYVHSIPKAPLFRLLNARAKNGQTLNKDWLDTNIMNDMREGDRIVLKTESGKKIPFNTADFAIPTDLKRIKEINMIGFSNDGRDAMGNIMGEIGFASDKGKSGKEKLPDTNAKKAGH